MNNQHSLISKTIDILIKSRLILIKPKCGLRKVLPLNKQLYYWFVEHISDSQSSRSIVHVLETVKPSQTRGEHESGNRTQDPQSPLSPKVVFLWLFEIFMRLSLRMIQKSVQISVQCFTIKINVWHSKNFRDRYKNMKLKYIQQKVKCRTCSVSAEGQGERGQFSVSSGLALSIGDPGGHLLEGHHITLWHWLLDITFDVRGTETWGFQFGN